MTDERLESKGCCDTNGKSRVGHTVENVSVYSEEVVGVIEIKLLKLLDSVASTSAEVALGAGEVGKDITNEEVFDLVRDRALFAQNNRSQGSDHAQSTLLGNMVLVLIGSLSYSVTTALTNVRISKVSLRRFLVRLTRKFVAATSGADASSK
jgi:hypothetical protein